jgi:hypothetical protein
VVSITGTKLGVFSLFVAPFSPDGSPQPRFSVPGIAGPGSVSVPFRFTSRPRRGPSQTSFAWPRFHFSGYRRNSKPNLPASRGRNMSLPVKMIGETADGTLFIVPTKPGNRYVAEPVMEGML